MAISDVIAGQMETAGKPRVSKATTTLTDNTQQGGLLDALLPILELYMYATMFQNDAGKSGLSNADIASGFGLSGASKPSFGVPEFSLSGNYSPGPTSGPILPTRSSPLASIPQQANPMQIISSLLGNTSVPPPRTDMSFSPELPASTIRDKSAREWGAGNESDMMQKLIMALLLGQVPGMPTLAGIGGVLGK